MKQDINSFTIGNRAFSREEILKLSVAVAMEKKAARPVMLDLRSTSAFTEFFAIVSAVNARQAYAIAESVRQFFKANFRVSPISVDGVEQGTWILLDYGFFFLHVFQDATRDLYNLEQLWNKAHTLGADAKDCDALLHEVLALTTSEETTELC